ncbi:MAG: hypothetical protein B7Y69_07120, partial [Sphingobacteriia bacterium 35-40-8]
AIGFVGLGLVLALVWVRLDAVDVALTEAAIGVFFFNGKIILYLGRSLLLNVSLYVFQPIWQISCIIPLCCILFCAGFNCYLDRIFSVLFCKVNASEHLSSFAWCYCWSLDFGIDYSTHFVSKRQVKPAPKNWKTSWIYFVTLTNFRWAKNDSRNVKYCSCLSSRCGKQTSIS